MALTYLYPGVYVEEVSTGARPIEAVGTSTAGFVGWAPDPNAPKNDVRPINNWTQFLDVFAKKKDEDAEPWPSTPLSHAVFGFFQNGGSRCYVCNVGEGKPVTGTKAGLELFEAIDEIAIVAAPGFEDTDSYEDVLAHCEKMRDRVAILDAPVGLKDPTRLKGDETGGADTGAPAAPATPAAGAPGATPPGGPPRPAARAKPVGRPRGSDYGTFYFPSIVVRDPLDRERRRTLVAPAGHVAGIWARTDATRGVHKAPANAVIRGALGVAYPVTPDEQGELNQKGVNCIRTFPREGVLVWGARTLSTNAEWRYVSVRRLFNMIEESIANSTRWVVFEPNDPTLWKAIRRDVTAFLMLLWREGALMGRTPAEAFFVQCDDETNPPEVIDAGRVVTRIGIAPVKPAEFVIFKIGQGAAGAEITSEGGG
jgi:hypothetical protein